jgi:hypothetical protein
MFEMDYSHHDKKTTPLAIKLARIYLEGKMIPRDVERAVEILNASTLIKAKYMLMILSFENKKYADCYHY